MISNRVLIRGIDVQGTRPTTAEPDCFPAKFLGPGENGLDAGVETRDVAAAG